MNPYAMKNKPAPSAIAAIKEAAAAEFGVVPADLDTSVRSWPVSRARQVGMAVAREVLRASLLEIAAAFNIKDHMSVSYALERVRARRAEVPGFEEKFGRVRAAAIAGRVGRAAA